jgi:hypothetical protein
MCKSWEAQVCRVKRWYGIPYAVGVTYVRSEVQVRDGWKDNISKTQDASAVMNDEVCKMPDGRFGKA